MFFYRFFGGVQNYINLLNMQMEKGFFCNMDITKSTSAQIIVYCRILFVFLSQIGFIQKATWQERKKNFLYWKK